MKIYSFFSFKGGVGRTALLTNIGSFWANRGRTVLLIDMDLTAPGITFSPLLGDWLDARGAGHGFSDLMHTYYKGRQDDPGRLHLLPPSVLIREVRHPNGGHWGNPVGGRQGRLLAIDAGNASLMIPEIDATQSSPPLTRVIEAGLPRVIPPRGGWSDAGPEETALRNLAEAIRQDLEDWSMPDAANQGQKDTERGIDIVLIDCRTGIPQLLEMSLGYLSDRMVLVSGLNEQNREGSRYLIKALQTRIPEGSFPETLRLVFSPVPRIDDELYVRKAMDANIDYLKQLLRINQYNDMPELFPTHSMIHYVPQMAVGDIPLVITHPHLLYCEEVLKVAEWLDADFSQESVSETVREGIKAAGEFLPPSQSLQEKKVDSKSFRNPTIGLPAWYWPLPKEQQNAKGRDKKRQELGKFAAGIKVDLDRFFTLLSWSISLSFEEKKKILDSLKEMNQFQVDSLQSTFDEEQQKFASMEKRHWPQLLSGYLQHQADWARLVAEESGIRRMFQGPVDGFTTHPGWEIWPEYWFYLAEGLLDKWRDGLRAEHALSKALAAGAEPEHISRGAELIPRGSDLTDTAEWMIDQLRKAAGENALSHFHIGFELQYRLFLFNDAEKVYQQVVLLADPEKDKKTLARAWGNLGNLFYIRGDLEQAEQYYRKSLALDEESCRKEGMASNYGNLGNLFKIRGDLEQTEQYYRKSLALDEELGRKEGMANAYGNLGILFQSRGDLEQAEQYYRKGLALDEELGRKEGMASSYCNLGNLFKIRGDLEQAEQYRRKSLALDEELGRKEGMASNYSLDGYVGACDRVSSSMIII